MAGPTQGLNAICPEISAQLKPYLNGLLGGFIKPYLPQNWVFRTETGVATLTVTQTGDARATDGPSPTPDVTIEWTQMQLTEALANRDKSKVQPNSPPKVSFQTRKGETAFNFLRSRFGI